VLASVLSLIFIVVISGLAIVFIYLHSEKFSDRSHVHVVVMSLSSLVSLTVAGVLVTFIHSAFIVSILFGLAVGYIIGKPLVLFAIVDGMIAGLMGGMMGAMAPMMAHLNPLGLTIFMDLIFILLISIIFKLIFVIMQEPNQEILQKESESQTLSG
jgi:hypothetical protein